MAGRKTRFVVGMDGGERELFSVEENSRGGLTINLPVDPPKSVLHIAETVHRFSVHESKEAEDGGFLIKETQLWSGGGSRHNYAYVRPHDGHALLPAFGRVSASLRLSADSAHKRRRDTVRVYDDHAGGPVFFVVTVSRDPLAAEHFPKGTTLASRRFKLYHLYVTAGVFRKSSAMVNSSITVTMMTSGPISDGVRYDLIANFEVPEAVSPTPTQLPFYIECRMAELSECFQKQVMGSKTFDGNRPGEKPEDLPFVERLERIRLADEYVPTSLARTSRSLSARMRYWRANPPEGVILHPENATWTFEPAVDDEGA